MGSPWRGRLLPLVFKSQGSISAEPRGRPSREIRESPTPGVATFEPLVSELAGGLWLREPAREPVTVSRTADIVKASGKTGGTTQSR
jgi:hypothetical protein